MMSSIHQELVSDCYRRILDREPDPDGLNHYAGLLTRNETDPRGIMVDLVNSAEFSRQLAWLGPWRGLKRVLRFAPSQAFKVLPRVLFRALLRRPLPPLPQSPVIHLDTRIMVEEMPIPRDGKTQTVVYTDFFRGEVCNFGPELDDQVDADFIGRFILRGHMPAEPILTRQSRITAFGSCFAVNIAKHLSALGFDISKDRVPNVHVSAIAEGLVNVYSILSQFEWALDGITPEGELWHGPHAKPFPPDEDIRLRTKELFESTDVFVLTFGLSEIWYDEVTGGVFWRAIPMSCYDPTRHKFRVCSHAETLAGLLRIHELIRRHSKAKIVFTLSPIPLIATFRPQSCVTASTASKAVLRSALDEFFRSEQVSSDPNCFYFPAYEMVTELFPSRFVADGRHPHEFIIEAIMKIFEAYYCETSLSRETAEQLFKKAQQQSATLAAQFFLLPLMNKNAD